MALEHLIFPSGDLGGNTALLWCGRTREGVLVDPAGEPEEILAIASERGVALRAVLLTHAHPDNLLAAPWLVERTECDLLLHRGDEELWEALPELCREFGWPAQDFGEIHEWLEEGAPVRFGRERLEVVHLPGHSPGSVGFVAESLSFALIGDTIFREGAARTDLPRGNEEQLSATLDRLQEWPETRILIPGHGPRLRPAEVPALRRRRSALL